MNIVNAFLDYFPSVGVARRLEMKSRLESLLKEYKEGMKQNENENEVIENRILDKIGKFGEFDFVNPDKRMSDKQIGEIFGSAEINEREKLANFIVTLLDFLSPPRNLNNSFKMSDSIISAQQHQSRDKNFEFYPIPGFIYESSPQFWKFFRRKQGNHQLYSIKEIQEEEENT